MKLRAYLKEKKKMDKDLWERKMGKINSRYQKLYKDIIKVIIRSRENQYYYYNDFDDISSYAMGNVPTKHVDEMYSKKFLEDYESSLDAILSQAEADLK